jgi:hypothetical protein
MACWRFHFNDSLLIHEQLEGSIDIGTLTLSATLYVRVPLWGRVKIISISGNLREGIKLSINVLVASGTIGLRLDGKDLRFLVDLEVKFVGKIKDDIKLFTLPYVSFPFFCVSELLITNSLNADSSRPKLAPLSLFF